MKAVLGIEKLKVLEMIYKNDLTSEFEEELSPVLGVEIAVDKKNINTGIVKLSIQIGEEDSGSFLSVIIAGIFSVKSDSNLNEVQVREFYEVNGTSILFPYLSIYINELIAFCCICRGLFLVLDKFCSELKKNYLNNR